MLIVQFPGQNYFRENTALPDNGPEEEKYYTYSFTYDNFLFLSLDQYVNSRKVNQNWIDTQFMNNDKPFVFAASHEPAFKVFWNGLSSYPEDRNTFWTSLVNHNGKIYFSGHSHFYDHSELIDKDDSPGNNVHQIVVGTGGGGFHSDSVYNGNNGIWEPVRIFHEKSFGYLLVKVTEASISTIWKHRVDPFNFVEGGDNYSYIPTAVNFSKMTPNKYELFQNFPNPFNPITVISYSIPSSVKSETLPTGRQEANVASDFSLRNVTLKVYDILGREVVTLVNQNQKPGNYEIEFDGSHLSTGIYLYRLQINTSGFTDNIAVSKKMILLK